MFHVAGTHWQDQSSHPDDPVTRGLVNGFYRYVGYEGEIATSQAADRTANTRPEVSSPRGGGGAADRAGPAPRALDTWEKVGSRLGLLDRLGRSSSRSLFVVLAGFLVGPTSTTFPFSTIHPSFPPFRIYAPTAPPPPHPPSLSLCHDDVMYKLCIYVRTLCA